MIKEHEIPSGSKLYFGSSAKIKRDIEHKIATYLYNNEFQEIVTPFFSYSNHLSVDDETKLIKINDESNNQLSLRFDSTLDVARIVTKRLGRTTSHKKWFYIQPVFSYPTKEEYQIGVEWLGENDYSKIVQVAVGLLKELDVNYKLQLSNIKIPQLIAQELNIDIDIFKNAEVYKLFAKDIDWLNRLIEVVSVDDLKNLLPMLPAFISKEVQKLVDIATILDYKNIIISPLFYAPLRYYKDFYFRVLEKNFVIIKGGSYTSEKLNSVGFSIDLDNYLLVK